MGISAGTAPKPGSRLLGPLAVGLALLSALLTFLIFSDLTPILPNHDVVVTVLMFNAATVLMMLVVIAHEVLQIVRARRRGRAAARLHVQIVGLFSFIAAVPAVLIAVAASVTLDRGIDRWFAERPEDVIENSAKVAEAYVREHEALIGSDIQAMAFDVARAKPWYDHDRDKFHQFLIGQATVRGLPNALIVKSDWQVIDRVDLKIGVDLGTPTSSKLDNVSDTQPTVGLLAETNTISAVIKLRGYDDTYLYVARPVEPSVVALLRNTERTVIEYASRRASRLGIQVAFALMYTVIALIVLLSAVWIGINFANRLVAPIRRLIGAANLVSTGNLYVQVPVGRGEGDLGHLGETFNKMTQELRTQRDDLMRAHDLIDSRRRFTEAVLSGASAGVIGVDAEGRVSILNRSAEKLIGRTEADTLGQPLTQVVPELAALFKEAKAGVSRLAQGQVTISRDGRERNLSVRVTTERSTEAETGYVITLDDITDLVVAQRTAAWADIARRIAHEIKNPLTPIQLSAERLRRKYGKVITEDRAVFEQCTDTIVRQVEDIKRMVDEFSRFARMPKPVIISEDVADTVRQVVFLMRVGHPDIDIELETAQEHIPAQFDRRLISQALTNIVKNATEAIAAVPHGEIERGRIKINLARDDNDIVIDVIDNGAGLPKENRNRLLEPYFTTREKGTGLGLAIVGRILEEHGGRIEFNDAPADWAGGRGAWARLRFSAQYVPSDEEIVPTERRAASDR
ncbi:MAG TPA: PAS domain-containing sensor histidine kinase [Xanthobacteraceae bacterium]|nr:PAS domain-containing sensor histidine kinase [Xanthobacteraceae bacterium]